MTTTATGRWRCPVFQRASPWKALALAQKKLSNVSRGRLRLSDTAGPVFVQDATVRGGDHYEFHVEG